MTAYFPPRNTLADLPPVATPHTPPCLGGCGQAMHSGRQVCPACWAQLPAHLTLAVRRWRRMDSARRANLAAQIEAYCGRERARPR